MATPVYIATERQLAHERIETAVEILNGPMALDLPPYPSAHYLQTHDLGKVAKDKDMLDLHQLRWVADAMSLIATRGSIEPAPSKRKAS